MLIDSPVFWAMFFVLMGVSTVGSLIISAFVHLPAESRYRTLGSYIRGGLLGVFISLLAILLYMADEFTPSIFMLFNTEFWVIVIASVLLAMVGKMFINMVIPEVE
jgi:hypothetical protein